MIPPMRKHWPLALILLVYLIIGSLYALLTPPWQTPDEPAHYNYVRQLAAGRLPVIESGDYDQAYLTEVVFQSAFAPQYDLSIIEYEDWQPPLYYLLQTPAYLLTGASLTAMRILSLLMGAGVVCLAYAIVLRLLPQEQWLALTTAVFVAFLPQHMAMMAALNNDSLAELMIAATLFLLVVIGDTRTQPTNGQLLLLGALLGLGYLTKGTVYPLTAVVGLVLLWRYWHEWRGFLQAVVLVGVPAFALGIFWWGRNMAVYGGLDILGKAAHDSVVVGQPRTAAWIAELGLAETLQRFVETTFNSFWGQFGWMTVPMMHPAWLYPLLWIFTGIVLVGLVVELRRYRQTDITRLQWFSLAGLLLLTLGVHVAYNLTFVQHQGRYLFPALVPIGFGVAVGLGLWIRPLRRRWPHAVYLIPLGLALLLITLDLYALFRVILPALA